MHSKDIFVYAANFRRSQGNQNVQDTSREVRVLKFGTKQRLIAQIKKNYKKQNFNYTI